MEKESQDALMDRYEKLKKDFNDNHLYGLPEGGDVLREYDKFPKLVRDPATTFEQAGVALQVLIDKNSYLLQRKKQDELKATFNRLENEIQTIRSSEGFLQLFNIDPKKASDLQINDLRRVRSEVGNRLDDQLNAIDASIVNVTPKEGETQSDEYIKLIQTRVKKQEEVKTFKESIQVQEANMEKNPDLINRTLSDLEKWADRSVETAIEDYGKAYDKLEETEQQMMTSFESGWNEVATAADTVVKSISAAVSVFSMKLSAASSGFSGDYPAVRAKNAAIQAKEKQIAELPGVWDSIKKAAGHVYEGIGHAANMPLRNMETLGAGANILATAAVAYPVKAVAGALKLAWNGVVSAAKFVESAATATSQGITSVATGGWKKLSEAALSVKNSVTAAFRTVKDFTFSDDTKKTAREALQTTKDVGRAVGIAALGTLASPLIVPAAIGYGAFKGAQYVGEKAVAGAKAVRASEAWKNVRNAAENTCTDVKKAAITSKNFVKDAAKTVGAVPGAAVRGMQAFKEAIKQERKKGAESQESSTPPLDPSLPRR